MWRSLTSRHIWQLKTALRKSPREPLRRGVPRCNNKQPTSIGSLGYMSKNHQHHNLYNATWSTPKFRLRVGSMNFVRSYSSLPPHTRVPLPSLSPTMEQGNVANWHKKEGDKLSEGDLLADIETDKATMGFETPRAGFLAKILVPSGTKDVPVGKLVCIIAENQADVAAFKDFKDDSPPPPPKAVAPAAAPAAAPAMPAASSAPATQAGAAKMTAVEQRGARVYASPMAKKLAEAQKLRLDGAGSGVFGSIKSTDLGSMSAAGAAPAAGKAVKAAKGPPRAPPGGHIDIPITNVRAVIAKRLVESKQKIPHYYVTMNVQVDKLMKLRAQINKKQGKKGVKVSLNDFIIKATATACRKVPETNCYWMDKVIRLFDNVDVSVAVATDGGLITPIVFSADRKGVIEISTEVKSLAKKARDNKLQPKEYQGGTVCVSNLGMFGVSKFAAVINPPQSMILAVGTTWKKLIVDTDIKNTKGFKEVNMLTATVSADHRTVDGALAAKWLQHFQEFMEDPQMMIV